MDIIKLDTMVKGWFIGDFTPSILRTKDFEIGLLSYPKGTIHEVHTHKIATEYNLITKGSMTLQRQFLTTGDIFIIYPNEVADPIYLEDTEVICIKVPSVPGDKYAVDIH